MTSFINFISNSTQPFQAQVTLDGQVYNLTVTYPLFGQRPFVNLYALDGTLIVAQPMTASPDGVAIESLSWSTIGIVTATTTAPHGYKVGSVVALTIAAATPSGYNGLVEALITGPDTFQYDLATDPGEATIFGNASFNFNLVGGFQDENGAYFTSTLIFRESSQQFEVNP
jgi:hypothetical protein